MPFIREVDVAADGNDLGELDTSFTSDFVYRVASGKNSLELQLTPVASQLQKRFPFDPNHLPWDRGYAAIHEGKLCGFIATKYESWNRRLTVVHFYVDLNYRRRGIGRQLLERAMESGRTAGARMAWVETSNFNHPGILAYQRLGFSLCGFDLTLYLGTPSEGEFAIYLACPISAK